MTEIAVGKLSLAEIALNARVSRRRRALREPFFARPV